MKLEDIRTGDLFLIDGQVFKKGWLVRGKFACHQVRCLTPPLTFDLTPLILDGKVEIKRRYAKPFTTNKRDRYRR